jgi:tripartite-type tricarboxylate transporter receptor subunit TctC
MPVLAHVSGESAVLLLSAEAPFRSIADLQSADRPIKWAGGGKTDGIADNAAVLSQALDLRSEIIIGYKGSKEAALAAIRGECDGLFASARTAKVLSKNGQLIAIAVFDRERSPVFPELPTIFEVANLSPEQAWWIDYRTQLSALGRTLIAAPGTPTDRLTFLRAAVSAVLTDPAVVAEAEEKMRPLVYVSYERIEELIKQTVAGVSLAEVERLREVILHKYY